jgi:hypothetical protein
MEPEGSLPCSLVPSKHKPTDLCNWDAVCFLRGRNWGKQLIPWSRVSLEKLTVTQLVKKFPAFYGTRRFVTVFRKVRHWSLSWDRWVQSKPFHIIFLRLFLILSSRLRLGLPSGLFRFSDENFYAFIISLICAVAQSVQRWATCWTIGVLGFDSRWGLWIFIFTTASRTALGPTQPPTQWVSGALSLGVKRLGREAVD